MPFLSTPVKRNIGYILHKLCSFLIWVRSIIFIVTIIKSLQILQYLCSASCIWSLSSRVLPFSLMTPVSTPSYLLGTFASVTAIIFSSSKVSVLLWYSFLSVASLSKYLSESFFLLLIFSFINSFSASTSKISAQEIGRRQICILKSSRDTTITTRCMKKLKHQKKKFNI